MANLDDLLKKASSKKAAIPAVNAPKRDFGLKKTMASIKSATAADSEASEQAESATPIEALPSKNKSAKHADVIQKPNAVVGQPDIDSTLQGKLDHALNESELSVTGEHNSPTTDMPFFEIDDFQEKNFRSSARSDTDLTQKRHRSDTNISENITAHLQASTPLDLEEVTQKRHRSDTKSDANKSFTDHRSDTDLTQKDVSFVDKIVLSKRSDTDLTQTKSFSETPSPLRSDTEVTQSSQRVDLLIQQVLNHSVDSDKLRSDTEVTQSESFEKSVSHLPKEVTRPRHSSDTEVTPYKTQKRHKDLTQNFAVLELNEIEKKILVLRGNQLSVFNFVCETLLKTGENLLRTSYELLSDKTGVNGGSIKTTTKRLRDAQLLEISSFGGGKGACIQVLVTDIVLKVFARSFKSRSDTEVTQNQPEKRHRSDTIQDTTSSSKLVSNNIINTLLTTEATQEASTSFDTHSIQINQLVPFGITRKQIQDIANQKLSFTTETLQDFVDRFTVYANTEGNLRGVKNIPGLFVKMAQLASKGQDPLMDVETEADRLIRQRLEALKQKQELRKKQQAELMELEFESWVTELKSSDWDKLVPPTGTMKSGSVSQRILLKNYFTENVWPERAVNYGF